MPSKYRLKRIFKGKLIRYLARGFSRLGVTPNQLTLFSPILAVFAGFFLFFAVLFNNLGIFIVGVELHALFLFLLMLFDGIDGALARMTDNITLFGGFLDSIMDRITDFTVIIGYLFAYGAFYYFIFPIPLYIWVLLAVFGFILVSYSRSIAEKHGLKDTNIGLAARSERLMILCVCSLILLPLVGLILAVFASNATALYRIIKYRRELMKEVS